MRRAILIMLFVTSMTSSFAQERIRFSVLGGYEHMVNEDIASDAGYGIGTEFKYSFYKRLYAVANFHMGVNKDFKPRTAISEQGEVDFSMHWKTYEYKAGIGLGANLLDYQRSNIYVQTTFGLSRVKYSYPTVTEYSPEVAIENREHNFFKYATSVSMGYNYNISKNFFIGLDYTGWWLVNYNYRHTCNAKIGVIL